MTRSARYAPGGMVFHVLNRGVGRRNLFDKTDDFESFERVLMETLHLSPMRVCGYCWMSNHWHFVLWPENDGDLAAFVQRLTNTHVKRWKEHRHETGLGPLYQGRYKSFPIQTENYFYRVLRYVERNALRANLVDRAEQWRWSSLSMARHESNLKILAPWPAPRPSNWIEIVNDVQTEDEVAALRRSVIRGTPYGDDHWVQTTAAQLGLTATLRPRGRPRKTTDRREKPS